MVDKTNVAAFKTDLRGELIPPTEAGYEAARHVYNGMIDKHPQLIARAPMPPMSLRRSILPASMTYSRQCVAAGTMAPVWGPALTVW